MAPVQFLFTSALILSAAVAAPIKTNQVTARDAYTSIPIRHHSEPMRQVEPAAAVSGTGVLPEISSASTAKDAKGAASSAIVSATSDNQQENALFKVLDRVASGLGAGKDESSSSSNAGQQRNNKQSHGITDLLTSLNTVGRRSETENYAEKRQLGLLQSIPDTTAQLGNLAKVAGNLPIKQKSRRGEESGMLGGLGGLGGVMGGSVKRGDEDALASSPSYADASNSEKLSFTEMGLKGFSGMLPNPSKGGKQDYAPEQPSAVESLGLDGLIKRGHASGQQKASYIDHGLKGLSGMFHDSSKNEKPDAEEQSASAAKTLGLDGFVKRSDDYSTQKESLAEKVAKRPTANDDGDSATELANEITGDIDDLDELENFDIDNDDDLKNLDSFERRGSGNGDGLLGLGSLLKSLGLAKRDTAGSTNPTAILSKLVGGLGIFGKRDETDSIDDLLDSMPANSALAGQGNSVTKRQLNVLSALATAGLSNAGATAGQMGKIASGKKLHYRDDDGIPTEAGVDAAMAPMSGMSKSHHDEHAGTDASDIADIKEEFEDLKAATMAGHGHYHQGKSSVLKRQVPPIAGSNAVSVVKGLVAKPDTLFAPVTKGILLGGKSLSDLADQSS